MKPGRWCDKRLLGKFPLSAVKVAADFLLAAFQLRWFLLDGI